MDETALAAWRVCVVVTHEPKTFAELQLLPIADYFIALLTDKTVVRAVAKTRRQKVISVIIWILGIVLGAVIGKLI